jgi:hypothetical protein
MSKVLRCKAIQFWETPAIWGGSTRISLSLRLEEKAKQEATTGRRKMPSVIVSVIGFLSPASFGTFFGSLFDPENRGVIFLWNVDISPNYTALQPKRPRFS